MFSYMQQILDKTQLYENHSINDLLMNQDTLQQISYSSARRRDSFTLPGQMVKELFAAFELVLPGG